MVLLLITKTEKIFLNLCYHSIDNEIEVQRHAYDLPVNSRRLERIANQDRGEGIQEMFYQQHVRRHETRYSLDGRRR